jgi:hypothetical protein
MKLLLVCGPFGSGTSLVAGLLAKLGAIGFGPFFETNDKRTGNSYELIAFRNLVQTLASERNLALNPGIDPKEALRNFRDRILNQEFGSYDENAGRPIFLKHPLSALVIPQICEVFDTRLIYVLRSMQDIEATRKRRHWPEHFGIKGAELIYTCMFTALVNYEFPTTILRYHEFIASPAEHVRKLVDFAALTSRADLVEEASEFVRKPESVNDSREISFPQKS